MPILGKIERIIVVTLVCLLALGCVVMVYNKSRPPVDCKIKSSEIYPEASGESRLVNINTASPGELSGLKGIGEVLAKRIIEYRESNGAFRSKEEIKNVKGIGDKLFDNIKDDISIE